MLVRISTQILKAIGEQLSLLPVEAYTAVRGGKPVHVKPHHAHYHTAPEQPPAAPPPPPPPPPAAPPAPPGDQPPPKEHLEETYLVPAENLSRLRAKLDDLAKRSVKLALAPISYTVGPPKIVEMLRHYADEPAKKVRVVAHEVTVTGGRPQLPGWEFIASLRHEPGVGTLIATVPGTSIADDGLKKYREAAADCDHCKLTRQRKDTYIVRATEDNPHGKRGDLKQVGSTCLADFTGGANAQQVANAAELLIAAKEASEGAEDFDGSGGGQPQVFPLDTYLAHVAMSIRESGWLSRGAARDRNMVSTADVAYGTNFPSKEDKEKARANGKALPEPTEADHATARDAMDWASAHLEIEAHNDYEHNLRQILRAGFAGIRTAGWAASILNYVSKQRGMIAERERAATVSAHQGTVGKRETFKRLTVERVIDHEGVYGTTHIHKMSDPSGNVFTWFSNSGRLDEGKTYDVTGTVKKHDVYNGVKQTVLTRAKGKEVMEKSLVRLSPEMAKAYKLQGHREVQGVPIAIENRVGSVRSGVNEDGNEWRTKMKNAYGYIKRTEGADGEEVDVFLGPNPDAPLVYIVHQNTPTGEYDEAKVMLGFPSEAEARAAYFANYDRRDLFDHIQTTTVAALKKQWRFKLAPSEPMELAKSSGATARVDGDPQAWLAAALHTNHPPERRAVYALMAKSAGVARALDPSVPWAVNDVTLDLAGAALFGPRWGVVRHRWGLPPASAMERLFVAAPADPVTTFEKAERAAALAWAADTLADPAERVRAFNELEDAVTS